MSTHLTTWRRYRAVALSESRAPRAYLAATGRLPVAQMTRWWW